MSTRSMVLVAAAFMAMVSPLTACAATPQEATIRELEQQQAKSAIAGDRAALERLFAADFRVINPSGSVVSRAELLDLLTGGGPSPYSSASYETQTVALRGDVAWSVGLETVVFRPDVRNMQGAQPGQTVQRRITHVWERQGGEWKLALRHATNVAPVP